MGKIKDLTGQKFGRLTVLRLDEERNCIEKERKKKGEIKRASIYWLCNCDCGKNYISIRGNDLYNNKRKSCGCLYNENAKNKRIDLTGKIFGRLTVIEVNEEETNKERERVKNGETSSSSVIWKCKCCCGNKNILNVRANNLLSGTSTSCGCYNKEIIINNNKNRPIKKNRYYIKNNLVIGYSDIDETKYFIIDRNDFDIVSKFHWHTEGINNEYWSAYNRNEGKQIKLHQLIMHIHNEQYKREDKNLMIDHINRNPSDNRYSNLRVVTYLENSRNTTMHKNNTSGKQGVHKISKTNKYLAFITGINGEKLSKQFNTFEEAVQQRIEWEKEFGYMGD